MSVGKLYTYPDNYRTYKALITAKYSGKALDVDKEFVFGETNKKPDFLKKFTLGKVPALELTNNGGNLVESNAIAYYVANDNLRGKSEYERAQVVQWLSFADSEILPAACGWLFPSLGLMNFNKQTVDKSKDEMKHLLQSLNDYLNNRNYLVGNYLTLADIVVYCTLLGVMQHVCEPVYREPFSNVTRWFTALSKEKNFKDVVGEVKLCEKAPVTATQEAKSGKKEKKEQPAQQQQKKKETPAKKEDKKKDEELDGGDATDEVLAAEPKQADPFEGKPLGKFNFDDFKRFYSNNDVDKSVPYFWEKFDKDNYSIWYCEYLYPQDLTKVYMSCNLIGGMFQRLDKLRKNAFSSMILFGEDDNSTISGIWIWRGHDLAFKLSPDWQIDFESYKWTKLDTNANNTKEMVKEYFSWEGNFDGKKFNQGKIFK